MVVPPMQIFALAARFEFAAQAGLVERTLSSVPLRSLPERKCSDANHAPAHRDARHFSAKPSFKPLN